MIYLLSHHKQTDIENTMILLIHVRALNRVFLDSSFGDASLRSFAMLRLLVMGVAVTFEWGNPHVTLQTLIWVLHKYGKQMQLRVEIFFLIFLPTVKVLNFFA